MTQDIRNDLLSASERGKKKFETFYLERFTNKTSKLSDTIHKENLKTKEDCQKGHLRTKYERKINRNSSRSRSACQGYFAIWCCSLPMLFDDVGFMMKPEKSELIRVLVEKLESGDYSYHHQPGVSLPDRLHGYCSQGTPCWSHILLCFAYQSHRDDWHIPYLWWHPISKGQWRVAESKCSCSGT